MKIIRPIAALLPLLILFQSGCAVMPRDSNVDLIVRYAPSGFWQQVHIGAKAAASPHGVQISYMGPEMDSTEQIEILAQSIQREPDAMMLVAADYEIMAEPMERVIEAGIDVVLIDSVINSDKWVALVSSDNSGIGAELAFELTGLVDRPGSVGVISFIQDAFPFTEREESFLAALSGYGSLAVLDTVYCNRSVEVAEQLAEDMIMATPDLVAIAGLNGVCLIGAARAIEGMDREDIVLVGVDLGLEGVHFMEQGILDVAIVQNPYLMGYYAFQTVMRHLAGEQVDRYIYTETRVIHPGNLFDIENQQLIFPFLSPVSGR